MSFMLYRYVLVKLLQKKIPQPIKMQSFGALIRDKTPKRQLLHLRGDHCEKGAKSL